MPARDRTIELSPLGSADGPPLDINIDDLDAIEAQPTAVGLPQEQPGHATDADAHQRKGGPGHVARPTQTRQQEPVARADEQQVDQREDRNRSEADQSHAGEVVQGGPQLAAQILITQSIDAPLALLLSRLTAR